MENPSNATSIHIMALDGIINVNSLFTLALFLGIINADPNNPTYTLLVKGKKSSSSSSSPCLATSYVAEDLIVYHVYSFSAFLFSSLTALALKQAIKTTSASEIRPLAKIMAHHVNGVVLKVGILGCACGSVFGCVFLMLGLVNLVQIKLGMLSCYGFYTLAACLPLLLLVPLALILYICIVLHAFSS
ncbi:unnamed protein product [Amaranthus hypochondriacus]